MATLELYHDGDSSPTLLEGEMVNSGKSPEMTGAPPGLRYLFFIYLIKLLTLFQNSIGQHTEMAFDTLDEPIRETIWRDIKAVGVKFKHVLYPVQKKSLLKVTEIVFIKSIESTYVYFHFQRNGTCGALLFYVHSWPLCCKAELPKKETRWAMEVQHLQKFL